ncbi:hypothetical protein Fmac_017726 [Flemingia macrophylla]|uniref:Uncharacterized protein n=1 Tax=Flemingia macrophylla TaxID=520843 RepID=A0ABD1M2Z3_9FABA
MRCYEGSRSCWSIRGCSPHRQLQSDVELIEVGTMVIPSSKVMASDGMVSDVNSAPNPRGPSSTPSPAVCLLLSAANTASALH